MARLGRSFPSTPIQIGVLQTSVDVTVSLTGQAATFAQGTLTPALSKALSGGAVASTQGSLIPALSLSLSGQAQSLALGTLTADLSKTLSGQAGTLSQGTISAGNDINVALNGQGSDLCAGLACSHDGHCAHRRICHGRAGRGQRWQRCRQSPQAGRLSPPRRALSDTRHRLR